MVRHAFGKGNLDDRPLLGGIFVGRSFTRGALSGGALFTGPFFGEGLSWGL